jgi:general secretion pathway protein H
MRDLPKSVYRHLAGFTLLEMLAVILLIGVAASVTAVSVAQGLSTARVNAASGELAATIRATRAQAVLHRREQVFDIDVDANIFRGFSGKQITLPKGMRVSVTSAREDQPSTHTGRIRFFPDGSSTGGRITLGEGHREWHVNVSWLTGTVSVVTS